MSHSKFRRGFSRADLITAIALFAIVMIDGVALVGCGGLLGESATSARTTARRMQNGTQIRGVHQGMVLFAQGNRDHYPGLDFNGNNIAAQQGSTSLHKFGAAAFDAANPTAAVYAMLLTGAYFSPEYALSPVEGESGKVKAEPSATPITNANYSYALLAVTDKNADAGRRSEWTDSNNSRAPIVGDRSKAIDPNLKYTSIHVSSKTADSADWQGSIGWNDNHVTFETTGNIKLKDLKIGNKHDDQNPGTDDLFNGAAAGKLDATTNALFAY